MKLQGQHVGYAAFSQSRNDIYWSIFVDGKTVRWSGYNDSYWWYNVSTSPQFKFREGFELDANTNEVWRTSAEQGGEK